MGLLQRAAETYDAMRHLVGKEEENRATLAPVGFLNVNASIEVTIDKDSNFITAQQIKMKVLIPVTEDSAGRTSTPRPHPLCEQLGYLSGEDKEKYTLYINQLTEWCNSPYSHEKAKSMLSYLQKGSLVDDLFALGLLPADEGGKAKTDKNIKDIVVFRVHGCGEPDAVWKDQQLIQHFTDYYRNKLEAKEKSLCYVSGKWDIPAAQHMKGIVSINGNAKIISANDKSNFTYLGRFLESEEAVEVSYEMSQKAHNALKWIIDNDGVTEGTRSFVCWNPQGKAVPRIQSSLFDECEDDDKPTPTRYREVLGKALMGYKTNFNPDDRVITAAFDAATTGRLSVSYYNEFGAIDFLERLKAWDETCCFPFLMNKVSSPSIRTIINVAFGTQMGDEKNARFEVDKRLSSQQMQCLFACRLEATPFPTHIMRAAVSKCANLQPLTKNNRNLILYTTCAIIRKYKYDHYKEEWDMALEKEKRDRSYQFGRLLAVMEKIESDTYENDEKRETNAIRLQSVFVKRPMYAASLIQNNLKNAYYPKLSTGAKIYYESLIGEIMEVISECSEQGYDKPLDETYILGYYLQKNDFYAKHEKANNEADETK